jgi:EAL domain-containing protein (putative c-di-GMP-specific phosphodiesterase class I)
MPDDTMVSINLSGEFIIKSGAFEIISKGLKHYKINPKRVCFEITETSALSNLTATQELIEKTSALGCQFSLDDFGTGTSSYEYLRQLRVDYVKIDGMFVRDIETDPINRKMVESIVGIAKAKNVKVVAECVENEEALVILQALGIDYYQGFVSHRPEPLEDYTALKL